MIFKLKEQREAKGISKKKLSEMSGVSRPVIIKMESGEPVSIKTDTLDALAQALRIEPVDLISH
jgi:transcriptional regulator with XRE-family HTH domain